MSRWIHHSSTLAVAWLSQALNGMAVPTAARNALVAQLAAIRDALHAPQVVLNPDGLITFLPQRRYEGAEFPSQTAPVVGAIPAPIPWECTAAIDPTGSLDGRRRATAAAITRAFELLAVTGDVADRAGTAPSGNVLLFEGPAFVFGDAANALLSDVGERMVTEDREVARLVTQTHVAALGMLRALASSRQSPMAAMPALSQAEQLGFESV
ncbi:MAG: hypothetical protein Q8Q09_06010, partial [Deltaproteobacteria bacterium]|nr:hypothetical protein [Deltaproteobacteria bacterium]